jgi:hypothetical protein
MSDISPNIRKMRLADQGTETDLRGTNPAQRVLMMWQLAQDAWAMLGDRGESRLSRHVVRVVRGKR